MPHRSFATKLLHVYYWLLFNFRLDFLIGLKIKFDVRHRNAHKNLILPSVRLKCAIYYVFVSVCIKSAAYQVLLMSETFWTMQVGMSAQHESCSATVLQSEPKSSSKFVTEMPKTLTVIISSWNLCYFSHLDHCRYKKNCLQSGSENLPFVYFCLSFAAAVVVLVMHTQRKWNSITLGSYRLPGHIRMRGEVGEYL